MGKTKIDWCDYVWNPVTGCTKVSEGCRNCYAERIATRFWKGRKFTDVKVHPERLAQVEKFPRGSRVFVNSMSDLFHKDVPWEFIVQVWKAMISKPKVNFLILTKRPEFAFYFEGYIGGELFGADNVWLGVSVEDQRTADERIPILLQIPAAHRFVSVEPMLEETYIHFISEPNIEWVICGGESGPKARPIEADWVRSLRYECELLQIPFFFKQWGSNEKGFLLDGKEIREVPEELK